MYGRSARASHNSYTVNVGEFATSRGRPLFLGQNYNSAIKHQLRIMA